MPEISDYVRSVFYRDMPSVLAVPDGWSRREELVPSIIKATQAILRNFQAADVVDVNEFANQVFDELVSTQSIQSKQVEYAGRYFRVLPNRLTATRSQFLEKDPIFALSEQIGTRFFADVFAGFRGSHPLFAGRSIGELVPASDRIVSLDDNQVWAVEQPISELLEALEQDNGIPDAPGVKERLVGEVRAGRELVRAGSYRAYLLYSLLIRALGELIERYQGSAIAMVAASLVDLLVKQALGAA